MNKVTIVTAGLSELTKDQIEQYNVVTVPYRIFLVKKHIILRIILKVN